MVQPQSELTGHYHWPPDLNKVRATWGSCPVSSVAQAHAHIAPGLVLRHMWQWPLGYPKGATFLPPLLLLHPCCTKGVPPKGLQALLKWLLEKPQAIKNRQQGCQP